MVILIGGVSCTGKTNLAQKLLEKYHIPYLSIDHIKMGLIRGNKYCDFDSNDDDDEITNKLWPIVKGIITTNIENNQNIIIEGCYFPQDQLNTFDPVYQKQIIPLFIGFSNHYLDNNFDSGIIKHLSEIELKELDEEYINQDHFVELHAKTKSRCLKNNVKYFEINDDDYLGEIKNVMSWIDSIKKQKGL